MATVIINDTTPRVKYTANGSTTRFDFDFVCFQTADLVVYVGDTVATTGFTITHDPTTLKGYVTFDTAPAAGTGITLVRRMAYDQKVDFTQVALLKRDPLNNEFSRVFAMIQQINEAIGRSVTVDVYSDATPAELTGMIEDLWAIKDDMTTDAANISAITTTAGSIANVNAVAGNATNINAVAGDQTNIDAVAGDLTNIDAAVANATNINAVAGNETNINAAVANATNINTTAANISDINTAAANIAAIIDAPNQASAAAASAALAEDWASKTDGPVEESDYSAKWYALNTDASGKANKDLSNLSTTGEAHFANPSLSNVSDAGRVRALGWGMPNYSQGSEVTSAVFASSGVGFTASKKGVCILRCINSGGQSVIYLYSGGSLKLQKNYNISGYGTTTGLLSLNMDVGDSVRIWQSAGTAGSDYWAMFYPLKGN